MSYLRPFIISWFCCFAGKDWVDTRSLEGEQIIDSAEQMEQAKENIKKRVEGEKKKKLLSDSS